MSEAGAVVRASKARPFYTRVAIAGLVVFALASLIFLILSTIQGGAEGLVYQVIFAVLSLIAAGLAWIFGRWALIVAAVIAFLSLLSSGFFLAYPLSHPNSFFDFFLSLLLAVGLLVALVGAIMGNLQRWRGSLRISATAGEIRAFGAFALAIVVLGIFSAAMDC